MEAEAEKPIKPHSASMLFKQYGTYQLALLMPIERQKLCFCLRKK